MKRGHEGGGLLFKQTNNSADCPDGVSVIDAFKKASD